VGGDAVLLSNKIGMRKNRIFEFALVMLVIAFVASWQGKEASEPVVEPTTAEIAVQQGGVPPDRPLRIGDPVPEFTLTNHQQEQVTYSTGQGPIFIVLTATGCGECLERIGKEDSKAYELAKSSGLEVWNLLVYQSADGATRFVETHQPSADQILADSSSNVSVKTLGGSDSTCWILIDGKGRLAYRGPVDHDALQKAMSDL
jgi:AhpC/TSA family protein